MRLSLSIKGLLLYSAYAGGVLCGSFDPVLAQGEPLNEPGGIVIERVDDSFSDPGVAPANALFVKLSEGKAAGRVLRHPDALKDFYEARGFARYWDSDADDLIEVLEESWTHGLNPFSYHLEGIRVLEDSEVDPDALDLLLSDAYIEYGRNLSGIRVNPAAMKSHRRYWQKPLAPDYLLQLLAEDDVEDAIESFTPQGYTYNRLREELIALVEEPAPDYEAVLPIKISRLLRPYEEHRDVPKLRVRLGVDDETNAPVYDDRLAAAVMIFQRDNGLKADGVIGPATLAALNNSRADKIHQVIVNLERLRWVPEDKPERFVVVNVPSAKLWAIDGGDVAFDMDVIVGRKKRPTNIFVTDITGVRFNPTWTVPPTIKQEDIVPKLLEDPEYLTSKGMELISGRGEEAMTLDPASIDWATIPLDELKALRMVQVPGAHNPLGQVRILMPNGYNIYLHDTNEKHYFQRQNRAASSGCVRMKDPHKMAKFILEGDGKWSQSRIDGILERGKIRDIFLTNTLPVYLVYYTAWVGEDDRVVYAKDLYEYDDALIKMLSNLDGFFIPVDNNG